jgi:hypothetical protein
MKPKKGGLPIEESEEAQNRKKYGSGNPFVNPKYREVEIFISRRT